MRYPLAALWAALLSQSPNRVQLRCVAQELEIEIETTMLSQSPNRVQLRCVVLEWATPRYVRDTCLNPLTGSNCGVSVAKKGQTAAAAKLSQSPNRVQLRCVDCEGGCPDGEVCVVSIP